MFTVHCQENDCGWSIFNQTEEVAYGRASLHSREVAHRRFQMVYSGEFTLCVIEGEGLDASVR